MDMTRDFVDILVAGRIVWWTFALYCDVDIYMDGSNVRCGIRKEDGYGCGRGQKKDGLGGGRWFKSNDRNEGGWKVV